MPLYVWTCDECGAEVEVRRTMADRTRPPDECDECEAEGTFTATLSTPAVARLKFGRTPRYHRHERRY